MTRRKKQSRGDELLREVLRHDAESGPAGYQIAEGDKRLAVKAGKGRTLLVYEYGHAEGFIAAMFDTLGFADYVLQQTEEVFDEYLTNTIIKTARGADVKLSDLWDEEDRQVITESCARFFMLNFIRGLQPKFSQAIREHHAETLVLMRGFINENITRPLTAHGKVSSKANLQREVDRLAAQIKSERRAFLTGSLDYIAGKPNYERLGENYERLLKVWQRAKEIYEQNRSLPTWRGMIRAAFPDVDFPDGLLTRLTGRMADLAEDERAAVLRTKGDTSPSSIAIEHAARECGATPYHVTARTLIRKLPDKAKQKTIKAKGVH